MISQDCNPPCFTIKYIVPKRNLPILINLASVDVVEPAAEDGWLLVKGQYGHALTPGTLETFPAPETVVKVVKVNKDGSHG